MSIFKSRRLRQGASKARALTAVVAVAVAAAFLSSLFRDRPAPPNEPGDSTALLAAPARYVPTVDEGLGASIAILLDVSGSMAKSAGSDTRPKYVVAREALQAMLETTDSFVARQPGFPVNVGLYTFSTTVNAIVPVKPYNRQALVSALAALGKPNGGTAIGDAMDVARKDLYGAGTFRKYILVVTDGENTNGRSPDEVAREIATRSEGAVRQYFVAFDIDKARFAFLADVNGEVLGAANGVALRAGLDSIYRGKILAEAMNAGETLPSARRDSGGVSRNPKK